MPTVTRRRSVAAPRDEVWRLVSEPERLPAWWPAVTRVEDATPHAWTTVMTSARGKTVRADYTRDEFDPPRRVAWRQELDESPFERILNQSITIVRLEPVQRGTAVTIELHQKLRGYSRTGGLMLRRATRKQLDEALEGLQRILG